MNEPAYRALTLRMPAELHAQVRAAARAHERSWGAEVRAIVREHLAREKAIARTLDREAS